MLRHDRLRRNQDKHLFDKPLDIVTCFEFRSLERVGTQVEQLRARVAETGGCIQTSNNDLVRRHAAVMHRGLVRGSKEEDSSSLRTLRRDKLQGKSVRSHAASKA